MQRKALAQLKNWYFTKPRKPLVIRGARQVGKTWLVRELAKVCDLNLIELNFELNPGFSSLFQSNDPRQILLLLESTFNKTIRSENSLLFLDEIQSQATLFAKLRWFAELLPEMPVVATGSLLEFVLADHHFSMPVGRISYFYLEPLSFEEFLALHHHKLYEYILNFKWDLIPEIIHEQLLDYLKEYFIIGGMPEAVNSWLNHRDLSCVAEIQHNLLATYRDDFSKYSQNIPRELFDALFTAIPKSLGHKFILSRVLPSIQIPKIKKALDLLSDARVCYKVYFSYGNGIPLGAEINQKYFKVIALDVGLVSAILGLNLAHFQDPHGITLINKGALAEQIVGQILRTIEPHYIKPELFYWQRESHGSNAEIDYLYQHKNQIIPIEVKAGSTGSLKSLHYFMANKDLTLAIRFNTTLPNKHAINFKTTTGSKTHYQLYSLPIYLAGQIKRLIAE